MHGLDSIVSFKKMIVVKSTVLKSYLVIVLFQSSCDNAPPHLLRVSTQPLIWYK